MKCPKCGNYIPDGSAFCNQCGSPLNNEIMCPSCNNSIPANSVFCPKCGKEVRNNMNRYDEADRLAAERQRLAEETRQREAQLRAREAQLEAQRQQLLKEKSFDAQENDDEEETPVAQSNYNRNLLVGATVIVGVILLLMVMRFCNGSSDRDDNRTAIADSTTALTIDGQDPLALFNSELGRSSFMGDGATTAFAVGVPAQAGRAAYIMGVTFLSDASSRSFYKIYRLSQNGSSWHMELEHTQYINGRSLSFDNNEIMASNEQVPRAVLIDGTEGLYFAYKNFPQGAHEGGSGRVSLAFFDVNNKKLTTIDYDGIIKRRDDGRQYVYGKPLMNDNSIVARFLKQEAQSVHLIYFPTEEELQAEKEALEEEEAAKALEGPENAAARWRADNPDKIANARGGQEVTIKAQSYDKPIFNNDNKHKVIKNNDYTVFSDKSGGVYGYNMNTHMYFVIYAPTSGSSTPTEIGFADSENSILNMRTAEGRFQYNLKTDRLKTLGE